MSRGLANTPRLVRLHIIGSVRNSPPIEMSKSSALRANWKSIGWRVPYKPESKEGSEQNIYTKGEVCRLAESAAIGWGKPELNTVPYTGATSFRRGRQSDYCLSPQQ